jgi:hypothetical protein
MADGPAARSGRRRSADPRPAALTWQTGRAVGDRLAGAARLQLPRRHERQPGIRGAADRPRHLHRGLHRRDRARRHPRGEPGAVGGGAGARPARAAVLRLIVLPQALRVIIPPMTSQYLNLTKNSSLAVAIGYPDIVSIANTTLNQTGQAIEGIAIIMAVYLTISLSISPVHELVQRAHRAGGALRAGHERHHRVSTRPAGGPAAHARRQPRADRMRCAEPVLAAKPGGAPRRSPGCGEPVLLLAGHTRSRCAGLSAHPRVTHRLRRLGLHQRDLVGAPWRRTARRRPRPAATSRAGRLLGGDRKKHRFMLFGTYPYEEHWRPALVCICCSSALYIVSAMRASGTGRWSGSGSAR